MIFEMSVGIDGRSRVGPTYLSIRGSNTGRDAAVPVPRSGPPCNRSGGLTRKPLSIVLNWSNQFLSSDSVWFSGLIDEIE